jgi:hypothetical protein
VSDGFVVSRAEVEKIGVPLEWKYSCDWHRYWPDRDGGKDSMYVFKPSCPVCRRMRGMVHPLDARFDGARCLPTDDGYDMDLWSIGRDLRKPPENPPLSELLAGVKEAVVESEREAALARRALSELPVHTIRYYLAEDNLKEALLAISHWQGYVNYYKEKIEREMKLAREAAKRAGDRVPGEDDGDEW